MSALERWHPPHVGQAWYEIGEIELRRGDLAATAAAFDRAADYGKDPKKKWRVDVNLHGRNATLTEVSFLAGHQGKATPKDQDYVMIDIYGRGNNAYRWAGETDVLEAYGTELAKDRIVRKVHNRKDNIDNLAPVVLRGFSMGGAGTWHIGLQRAHLARDSRLRTAAVALGGREGAHRLIVPYGPTRQPCGRSQLVNRIDRGFAVIRRELLRLPLP